MTQIPSAASEVHSATLPSPAVFEAAGLYDPAEPNAADRLELLEYLVSAGINVEWMSYVYAAHGLTGLLEGTERRRRLWGQLVSRAAQPSGDLRAGPYGLGGRCRVPTCRRAGRRVAGPSLYG